MTAGNPTGAATPPAPTDLQRLGEPRAAAPAPIESLDERASAARRLASRCSRFCTTSARRPRSFRGVLANESKRAATRRLAPSPSHMASRGSRTEPFPLHAAERQRVATSGSAKVRSTRFQSPHSDPRQPWLAERAGRKARPTAPASAHARVRRRHTDGEARRPSRPLTAPADHRQPPVQIARSALAWRGRALDRNSAHRGV